MTTYMTYLQLKTKIQNDCDLSDETFITPSELLGYFNEAIKQCETLVHGIYEDYFIKPASINMVALQEDYDLPADIYAFKIRGLIYKNGTIVYPVERMRDWHKFVAYAISLVASGSNLWYRFFLYNASAGAPKIKISPPSRETGAFLTIWYLRTANVLAVDSDIMDIPEANNYVMQWVKMRVYEKEGNPLLAKALADTEREQTALEGTLTAMVPDNQNDIEADLSFYRDHT